jgi:hypothetical protein
MELISDDWINAWPSKVIETKGHNSRSEPQHSAVSFMGLYADSNQDCGHDNRSLGNHPAGHQESSLWKRDSIQIPSLWHYPEGYHGLRSSEWVTHYRQKPLLCWSRVWLSSESCFHLNSSNGRMVVFWRRGERFARSCVTEADFHGEEFFMMWEAISMTYQYALPHWSKPTGIWMQSGTSMISWSPMCFLRGIHCGHIPAWRCRTAQSMVIWKKIILQCTARHQDYQISAQPTTFERTGSRGAVLPSAVTEKKDVAKSPEEELMSIQPRVPQSPIRSMGHHCLAVMNSHSCLTGHWISMR